MDELTTLLVFRNGVYQTEHIDYEVVNDKVVFNNPCLENDIISIVKIRR